MDPTSRIIGSVVAEVVREELVADAGKTSARPMIRVESFQAAEIVAAAKILSAIEVRPNHAVVCKIACRGQLDGADEAWLLSDDETLVQYRNRVRHGLVIFDYEEQPEAQSLRNMRVVSDGTILDAAATALPQDRRRFVLTTAWTEAGGEGRELPEVVFSAVERVFLALSRVREISLRAWVRYLTRVCEGTLGIRGAVTGDQVRPVAEEAMMELLLFPDPDLLGLSDAAVQKRIRENHNLAGMGAPNGKALEEEEIERRIEAAVFIDAEGLGVPPLVRAKWQEACRALLYSAGERDFSTVPFSIWRQLFSKEREKKGLGTRIREELESSEPGLIDPYDELGVSVSLDEEDQEAARSFLDSASDIVDVLSRVLQRAVFKLAHPPARSISDPLAALLRIVYESREAFKDSADSRVVLEIEGADDKRPEFTLALFRFLYARTLDEIVQNGADSGGAVLQVAEELLQGPVNFLEVYRELYPEGKGEKDGEGRLEVALDEHWGELRLVVKVVDMDPRRVSWRPLDESGKAALVRLICDEEAGSRYRDDWDSLEEWCEHAMDPERAMGGDEPEGVGPGNPTVGWRELRREAFEQWRQKGVSSTLLSDYCDRWLENMERVRREHAPHGSADHELDSFLDTDTLRVRSGRFVLLATHPLRLRWQAKHWEFMSDQILKALDGELQLNDEVDEFYFDQLDEMSPHKQPAVISPGHGQTFLATREFGGHEEFSAVEEDSKPSSDWISSVDDKSIEAMAAAVIRFLDAYPHKTDGLSLLFVSRDGEAAHVERLLRTVRRGEHAGLVVTLHVIAPILTHAEIARRLEALDDHDRTAADLLPPVRTVLHPDTCLEDEKVRQELDLEERIDIALVPNLFGTRTRINEHTKSRGAAKEFRVLHDPSTHELDAGVGRSENVSRAFLPERGDEALETWSTINVWRKRESPVQDADPEAVDYFGLQVRFSESMKLFWTLHHWAHWVVTLDPFVGREQIEVLDNRPDVITVRPNVGKNGQYTLVVSSSAGRRFVESRLRSKLTTDLAIVGEDEAARLAQSIYESSRVFAPGTVLRALGLGRTAHEILGLVAARWALEQYSPRPEECELEAWVSLDDFTHWFGGPHRYRADLLRVLGMRVSGRLKLRFQVLEAKFREVEDAGRGDEQLKRTLAILEPAFGKVIGTGGDQTEYEDAPFWRRELVDAIQQASGRAVDDGPFNGLWVKSAKSGDSGGLSLEQRADIADGNFDSDGFSGILCTVSVSGDVKESMEKRSEGFEWIRIGKSALRRILSDIADGKRPKPIGVIDQKVAIEGESPKISSDDGRIVADTGETSTPRTRDPFLDNGEIDGGLSIEELEGRYQIILNAFEEFRVNVKRAEGVAVREGPAFYEVRVVPGRGVRADKVMDQASELKLKLRLPESLSIRAFLDRGAVVFQIPKEDAERYFVSAEALLEEFDPPGDALVVPIGHNSRGERIDYDFSSSESPHLLIGGTTGSGKSVALLTILNGLCRCYGADRLRLILVDPKGTELNGFEATPHLDGEVGWDAADATRMLEAEVVEMQRRYHLFREHRCRDIASYNATVESSERVPWRVLVLDEYADLTSDPEDRKGIEGNLRRLAQKARASGIHLIVATQKPSAEILSTSIRSNFPAQLALRVKTSQDSRIVMDETGAETLAGKGDAFLKTAKSTDRIQVAS